MKTTLEFEALGLVDGQNIDRVFLELSLGRGRIVSDLLEEVEVLGKSLDRVVLHDLGEILDPFEKEPEILDFEFGIEASRFNKRLDIARLFEESEDHLAGVLGVGEADEMKQVLENSLDALDGFGLDLQGQVPLSDLPENAVERDVSLPGVLGDGCQAVEVHSVDFGVGKKKKTPAVLEIGQGPDEGDEELDLLLGIKAPASGKPEGHLFHIQRPEKRVGVGVPPDEDGHLSRPDSRLPFFLDELGHAVGLVRNSIKLEELDALSGIGESGDELLILLGLIFQPERIVVLDQGISRIEDLLRRTIVLGQDDFFHLDIQFFIIVFEGQDIGQGGPPKTEDALVIVSHDGEIVVAGGQEFQQLELDEIGVLEFVDKNIVVSILEFRQDGGSPPEHVDDQPDLVLEIDLPLFPEEGLVGPVDPGDLQVLEGPFFVRALAGPVFQIAGVAEVFLRADILLLELLDRVQKLLDMPGGNAERTVVIEGKAKELLPEKDGLFDVVQEPEIRRISEVKGIVAQNPLSKRVERADFDEGRAVRDEQIDPLLHLVGRFLGKGYGQDLFRFGQLGGDEVGDPLGDDPGLAGSGAGDDEKRPLAMDHRPLLFRVEVFERVLRFLEPRPQRFSSFFLTMTFSSGLISQSFSRASFSTAKGSLSSSSISFWSSIFLASRLSTSWSTAS